MAQSATAASVVEQFENNVGVDVDDEDVEAQLDTLVNEYKVPEEEARRSVVSKLLDQYDIERDEFYARSESGSDSESGNDLVGAGEIDAAEEWVDMHVEVAQLWEPNSESIAQVGLLADETGRIKFVSWATSDLPELEEGEAYSLTNLVTDEYDGRYSVKLNRTTGIEALEGDIDAYDPEESITTEGALVAIQPGSGLIRRCPEEGCTRVLSKSRCSEHGEVEGERDLRIKAALDDGHEVESVIFDREATEAVTGWSMEDATSAASDALDPGVVADAFREQLIGRYFEIEGPVVGEYHLVNEVSEIGEDVAFEADAARLLDDNFDFEMA